MRRILSAAFALSLCVLTSTASAGQEPGFDPTVPPPAPPGSATDKSPPGDSPVVRATEGNWAFAFLFGGLGTMKTGGQADLTVGMNTMFTEFGVRAVLGSVIIPFSAGLAIGANVPKMGDTTTDFGLSATVGVVKTFRVWRRIVPQFGGSFHFHYLDPSTPAMTPNNNWVVGLSLGPVIGVEYYIADRVSILTQGTFQFGINITDPVAQIGLGTSISGGGQLGLNFYF
jgi:hypothetical protein